MELRRIVMESGLFKVYGVVIYGKRLRAEWVKYASLHVGVVSGRVIALSLPMTAETGVLHGPTAKQFPLIWPKWKSED